MIENCVYEVWNYKYNQFTPVEIKEKVDSRFVKIHGYAKLKDRIEEYDTMTYLKSLKNVGSWEFDILKLFQENSMVQTGGYRVIVDKAEFDKNKDIRVYYKYIECDENLEREIKSKFSAWSWINSYGAQMKKINSGYNFITLRPEDKIEFRSFIPSRLGEHRKEWYFEDPVNREVIVHLENLLGYTRDGGETWMEYFWKHTDGAKVSIKINSENLICFDVNDPKKPIQVCSNSDTNEFIEEVVKYYKKI